jgi:hypothetical protein
MNNLIDKMRKARESSVKVAGYTFTIRRPTDMDALGMTFTSQQDAIRGIMRYIIGWGGVTELDLVPGGTKEPVPFDSDLFEDWVQDRPDLWQALTEGVRAAYQAHTDKLEASAKN